MSTRDLRTILFLDPVCLVHLHRRLKIKLFHLATAVKFVSSPVAASPFSWLSEVIGFSVSEIELSFELLSMHGFCLLLHSSSLSVLPLLWNWLVAWPLVCECSRCGLLLTYKAFMRKASSSVTV